MEKKLYTLREILPHTLPLLKYFNGEQFICLNTIVDISNKFTGYELHPKYFASRYFKGYESKGGYIAETGVDSRKLVYYTKEIFLNFVLVTHKVNSRYYDMFQNIIEYDKRVYENDRENYAKNSLNCTLNFICYGDKAVD